MNIRVDLTTPINDGTEVVFRSPVDCSQITGLIVYYQNGGNTLSKEFAFADAHGNNVGDIDHLFAENVVVKVILDVTAGMAFVQNADTNAYLEWRFKDTIDKLSPAFTETGSIVTCEPVEGYPLEVVAHDGFKFVANLSGDGSDAGVRYTAESGATYRVDMDSAAEIYDVYVETVSGQNITVTSADINGLTASMVFTTPEDLNEDILIVASNGFSSVDYTVYKPTPATKIFRTGKNLCYVDAILTYTQVKYHQLAVPLSPGTYKVSYDNIVSTDTETTQTQIAFFTDYNGTRVNVLTVERGRKATNTITLTQEVKYIYFYAAQNYTASIDDTATITNFMVSVDGGDYEPYNGGEFTPGEEVPALQGVNTIWADVGEVTVTGRKDPIAIIEKLSSAVTAMLGG